MNTKSNFKVALGFEDLFSFESKEEKLEHRAQMISYRILSEVERICEDRKIKMKDLAKMVDASASYITQLFRGNRQVNTAFMAKLEESFNMLFDVKFEKEVKILEEIGKQEQLMNSMKDLNAIAQQGTLYFAMHGNRPNNNIQYLEKFKQARKKSEKQIA